MAENIIGSSIGEELHKQLTKREAHFAATTRNKSILEYLSSTNSWIKLRSSVNHEKTSDKAKGLVLTGGTLDKDGNMRAGISSAGTTVGAGSKAYHTSTSTGFKPMPGITGLTVKAKGTWGVLKEATVKLKVFSKEDLDDLETVYFRIGYSMLLEYGHTLYIDNEDDIIKSATSAHCVKNTTWFGDNQTEKILDEIKEGKEKTCNNYDALYGFVSNFNWSLQSDGTYDCSIDIISKGIILEGLKNSNVTSHTKKEELENEKEEQDLKDKKSTIHYICERLIKNEVKEGNIKAELKKANAGTIGSKLEKDHPFIAFKPSVGEGGNMFMRFWRNTTNPVAFISLGALLDILNTFEMMKDNKGRVICKFLIDSEEKYKTFPGHYTTNPLSVILPEPPAGPKFDFAKPSITHSDESKVNDMQGNAKKAFSGKEEYITSILVSTYMIEAQLDKVLDVPTEKGTGIFEVLKSILAEVNYSLGITGLDLYYNEEDETYKIIDKEVPLVIQTRPKEIKISGLGTTVSDISVVSEINAEMKSMVSISAQATTGDYSEDMSNMLKFNKGCIDRHYYTKDQQTLTDEQKEKKLKSEKDIEKAEEAFTEKFKLAWGNFNEHKYTGGTVINPEFWKDLHSEAVMNLNRSYQGYLKANPQIVPGIPVPIKLNMTLKGISGFKIGSTFTVNTDIIPKKYKKYAFYVMGIDHTVAADGWKTNVSAYMKVIN